METAPRYGADVELPQLTLVNDFCYGDNDESNRSTLAALEGTHDHGAGPVTVTVLREHGPGGGWPRVSPGWFARGTFTACAGTSSFEPSTSC